jgi:8-amino-7-oxononanoate synthase
LHVKHGSRPPQGEGPCPPPSGLRHLRADLDQLVDDGLLRVKPRPTAGLSFCSNDYLGLAGRVVTGLAGAGASRLIAGECAEHGELEDLLSDWLGLEGTLLFSSGYAANVGALSALAGPGDVIVSDALNHASIIDGARLSRATVAVVPHLDLDAVSRALEQASGRRAWMVTESYFSMDADSPDLLRLRTLCDEHDAALYVDEAHALGVLGPGGRGLCAAAGIVPDVLVGTFGKAFGASGAFVAGCADLVAWLWNRARSFVFSTGLSPCVAVAARQGVVLAQEPRLRARALDNAVQLRQGLSGLRLEIRGHSHVIPWVVGASDRAMKVADALRGRGILVSAIRPPSVPAGSARLRLTATANQSREDIQRLIAATEEVLRGAPGELRSLDTAP